ncbi:unnamed protein product [Peniophora sp. CBMAI 1063]|nr:unnamed protein product [Peniophora sp. CBMAI 1063]
MRCPSRQPNSWGPPSESDAISIDDLSPLIRLNSLRCIDIAHVYPIKVTDAELVAFAGALPQLEALILNECPSIRDVAPTLTIDCLPALAQVLPRLEILGLFFDASNEAAYKPASHTFQRLKLARLNRSPVNHGQCRDIALYLSTVLTDGTELDMTIKHIRFDVLTMPCPSCRHWKEIDRYFSVIMESRRWTREARAMLSLHSLTM